MQCAPSLAPGVEELCFEHVHRPLLSCFFSSTAIFEKDSDPALSIRTSRRAVRTVAGTGVELYPHAVFLLQVQSEMKGDDSTVAELSGVGEGISSCKVCM